MENLQTVKRIKANKPFNFQIAMTLNRVNHGEVYQFFQLADSLDAIPYYSMVVNPGQGRAFDDRYLAFTKEERQSVIAQIDRAAADFPEKFKLTTLPTIKKTMAEYWKHQLQTYVHEKAKGLQGLQRFMPKRIKYALKKLLAG